MEEYKISYSKEFQSAIDEPIIKTKSYKLSLSNEEYDLTMNLYKLFIEFKLFPIEKATSLYYRAKFNLGKINELLFTSFGGLEEFFTTYDKKLTQNEIKLIQSKDKYTISLNLKNTKNFQEVDTYLELRSCKANIDDVFYIFSKELNDLKKRLPNKGENKGNDNEKISKEYIDSKINEMKKEIIEENKRFIEEKINAQNDEIKRLNELIKSLQKENQNIFNNLKNKNDINLEGVNEIKEEERKGEKDRKIEEERKREEEKRANAEIEGLIRADVDKTPLVSEKYDIITLVDEYTSNEQYLNSVQIIANKYKSIRKIRRDGNCFYRGFIYRIFEHISLRNDRTLYTKMTQKFDEAKKLAKKNLKVTNLVDELYNVFIGEFCSCFNSLSNLNMSCREYLDRLYTNENNEKCNYLILFIRYTIAEYLRQNKEMYEAYAEYDFDNWLVNEVESFDKEVEQIQIMACVNFFDVGVKIEHLNKDKNDVMIFPEGKDEREIFITFFFTPGHYDLLYDN